jgi:hypothetical protein
VLEDVLEAMAYVTLKAQERNTLLLVGHEGGWMPGDELERVDVVVATRTELSNLPGQVEYELPESGSWGEDLQVYLAEAISLDLTQQDSQPEVASRSVTIQESSEQPQSQQRGMSR